MEKNESNFKKIIELGRFRFLIAGFFLYLMGSLLAIISGVDFSIRLFVVGYAIMMPAHLSLSYSNNYFDIKVDEHNKPISISGGTKILIDNPHLIPICKYIAILLIVLSIAIAALFVFIFSYSILFIGFIVFGNLLGWFYTGPPIHLAYHGLGEIGNMINMGLLMPGIGYWVIKGNLDLFFFIFAIPFFLYGLHFMIVVETPDMEGDIKGKKKTLIARYGRKYGYIISLISLSIASIYYFIIGLFYEFDPYIFYPMIGILSLIPLSFAIHGWLKEPFTKIIATDIAVRNMMGLVVFILLINIYFVLLLFVL